MGLTGEEAGLEGGERRSVFDAALSSNGKTREATLLGDPGKLEHGISPRLPENTEVTHHRDASTLLNGSRQAPQRRLSGYNLQEPSKRSSNPARKRSSQPTIDTGKEAVISSSWVLQILTSTL